MVAQANRRKAVSLYRNWRPRTFTDLVGQDAVVRTLSQALRSDRLVHAYLFSGPRGSGKTSAAKIMARCITCVAGPTPEPDNTCENCRSILDGTALDVVEIDAASNRGIDEIRALRDAVKFAPSTMRKKVYIVDEAHMLTKEGANAFLKTLEEPPPHVVFILATTAPESLPVTILSRCQRYAFRRISTPVMVARMAHIAAEEGIGVDPTALGAIAYRADGGLRDALTMLEQAAAFGNGTIDVATVEAAFGAGGRVYAGSIIEAFIGGDPLGVITAIEAASDAGTEMANLIRSIIAELRHIVIARVDGALLDHDLIESDAAIVRERALRLPQVRALRALRLLSDALMLARTSGNARLELESAMLRLTLQAEDPTLEALATRVRELEEQLQDGSTGAPLAVRDAQTARPPTQVPSAVTSQKRDDLAGAPPGTAGTAEASPRATAKSTKTPRGASAAPASPIAAAASPSTTAADSHDHSDHSDDAAWAGSPPEPSIDEPDLAPAAPGRRGSTAAAAKPSTPSTSATPTSAGASPVAASPPAANPVTATPTVPTPPTAGPTPALPPIATAAPGEVPTLQRVKALWQSVTQRAESEMASLRGPLSRTSVENVDGWNIALQIGDEHNAAILRSRINVLERALEAVLGGKCQVGLRVVSGTASRNAKKDGVSEPADATLGLLDYAAKRLGAIGDENPW